MQRWILLGALGVVGLVVMFFGARYAKRQYHLSQPDKVWVPVPLRMDLPMEEQINLAKQIDEKLRTDEILRTVVIDVGLKEKFKQPSEDAAVKELSRRLFVEVGTYETPMGFVPTINVGVAGIGHENTVLKETSIRVVKFVHLMNGIDPETGKPIEQGTTPPPDEF